GELFLRPKPAAPPAELPRMNKGMGAVKPLAHLHAEWLGVDPGKTSMATVAHKEHSADGLMVSVWQRTLTAGQYYRDSGITRQAQATKIWLAKVKTQLTALSQVSSKPSSLASYRQFADTVLATYDAMWAELSNFESKPRWANAKFRLYCGKKRVVAGFWSKLIKQAKQRWPDRALALAYGAAGFSGSGSVGCRGVPVSQIVKEALRQFPAGRVFMVDEFRTSRVSSAYSNPSEALPGQPPESFSWLRPVYSSAKRSQVRGLMCSTSNNIRFYDRDVSAALNIRRCAVSPGPRPTELCYWDGRPAMPKRGRPGQEWVYLRDKALLRGAAWLQLEEDMAEVSIQRHGRAKQLVVFFAAASIGTRGGWGADAVLRACCKVVCRPRGTDQRRGRVVLVDEHHTSRVSSAVNGQQPCESRLSKRRATRPADWKPPAGQVAHRLVRPAWSQQRDQPVRGMMWCPVLAPRKPPQAPRSSQVASQPAASEPGPSTPLPAKRCKRTKAEPAAEPNKGKAAKTKPAPQPGRWLDRDCNAALNMQRIGESKWRPLELCFWPDQGALPAKGKEYPGLGYKRLRDKPPKAQQQPAVAQ
ncbi:hypothetical protein QJQ45_026907, partial [Haematococcus lacustris]